MLKKISRYVGIALAAFAIAGVGKIQAAEVKEMPAPSVTSAPSGGEIWQDSSRVKKSGNYEYHILSESAKLISIRKIEDKSKRIVIPETLDGYKVVGIGRTYTLPRCLKIYEVNQVSTQLWRADEFENPLCVLADSSKKASELIVPSSVCFIGENAFANSKYLKKVMFKKRKERLEINLGAFEGCKALKNLEIPKRTSFPDSDSGSYGAFAYCGTLESVKVGCSIYEIEKIFYKTQIKKMSMAKAVKEISFNAITTKSNSFEIKKLCVEGKNTKILNTKKGFAKVKTLVTVKGAKVIPLARKNKLHYQVCNMSKKRKVTDYKYDKKKKKWTKKVLKNASAF